MNWFKKIIRFWRKAAFSQKQHSDLAKFGFFGNKILACMSCGFKMTVGARLANDIYFGVHWSISNEERKIPIGSVSHYYCPECQSRIWGYK